MLRSLCSAAARRPGGVFALQSRSAAALSAKSKAQEALRRERQLVVEHMKLLVAGKKASLAPSVTPLRVGQRMCEVFGIPHPARKVMAEYKKLIAKHLPQLQAEFAQESTARRSQKEKLEESAHSCFRRTDKLREQNAALLKKYSKFLVLDFETTTKVAQKRKASPFAEENRIVYTAYMYPDDKEGRCDGPFEGRLDYRDGFPDLTNVECLVGHNIKFDLLHCWEAPQLKEFFRRGGVVWDTMYGEYLTNGHKDNGSLSLDELSLKYGGKLKDNFIAEQWAAGVDTPDIDPTRVREYAKGDVENTRLLFKRQLALMADGQRLPLVLSHMEGLLATTEMEFNGVYVREDKAELISQKLQADAKQLDKELAVCVPDELRKTTKGLRSRMMDPTEELTFNWASATQLRAYLFGGTVKYKLQLKNDRGKYTIQQVEVEFPGIVPNEWRMQYSEKYCVRESDNGWKVNEEVLNSISERYGDEPWARAIRALMEGKKKKKLQTYLQAFISLRDTQGLIHPQLNHVLTRTGRLSSNNPNMQNIPRSGVKECLVSRFNNPAQPEAGVMIESDYSQLEVFVNALLSQDKNLMQTLEEGLDLHCKRLATMKGMDYDEVVKLCKVDKVPEWVAKRTQAKVFSFQRQYGASNKTIAAETKMSIEEVMQLADSEEKMYPEVARYFERVTEALYDTAQKTGGSEGFYDGPSGNRWYFQAEESKFARRSPTGKVKKTFRRQLVLNHPVQGFAAEIVLTCLGRLWRRFLETGNFSETGDFSSPARALMVNTVHDCVWVDAKAEVKDEVMAVVTEVLADVRTPYAEKGYAIQNWVKFKTETHAGPTMADV